MFSIEDIHRAQLQSSIGNNQSSNPEDVINTREKFAALGRHSAETNRPYIDGELDQSIRNFQGDKGLKQDGIMHPGGETDRSLNRNISRLQELGAPEMQPLSRLVELSASVGDGQENRETDVQNVQRSLGEIGLLSEKKMTEPNGIVDRETLDGIREFQGQNNLRIDGKINPDGETNVAINSLADLQAVQKQRAAEGDAESENLPPESRPLDEEENDCTEEKEILEDTQAYLDEVEAELNAATSERKNLQDSIKRAVARLAETEKKATSTEERIEDLKVLLEKEKADGFKAEVMGRFYGAFTGGRGGVKAGRVIGGALGKVGGSAIEEGNDKLSGRKTIAQIEQEIAVLTNQISVLRKDIETLRKLVVEPEARIQELSNNIENNLQPVVDSALRAVELAQKILDRCKNAKT